MVKTNPKSRIEVWATKYINKESPRYEVDENAIILQIECGSNDNYIVEVIDVEDYEE